MAVINHRYRIAYFPIHKCASTSIKNALYLLETERRFSPDETGGTTIHQIYRFASETSSERWRSYFSHYLTFVVVRDPIKRALSAYAHRVLLLKCLEEEPTRQELARLGLGETPTADEFFANLDGYAEASDEVRRHIRPQAKYIGPIVRQIGHIVPIERIAEAEALLSQACGKSVAFEPSTSLSPKVARDDLSSRSLDLLKDFYREDYRMLADFYDPSQ